MKSGTHAIFVAAFALGAVGASLPARAQSVTFPPGTNCMMLTANERPDCLAQAGQQGSIPRTTIIQPNGILPNGAANTQNPTSNPSALTGPSATVAPSTSGPSSTVAPNTTGPSATVAPNTAGTTTIITPNRTVVVPNGGSTVNASRTVIPNTNPNAVTAPGTVVSPNAVTAPGSTVSPNSVQMPGTTGPTTPIIIPPGATINGGGAGTGTTGGAGTGGAGAAGGGAVGN